jgi:putative phage-type endonuclease
MEAQAKYISTVELTKDEWLQQRKNFIGASEIGAVLGFNKYRTPYEVWQDKTTRDIIEVIETPAMRRGTRMEEIVAEEYASYTGNTVRKDNKIRIHPTNRFISASLDRIIVDKGDGRGTGVLECKTVSSYAKKSWEEEIPLSYFAQLQQQLYVTGYRWGEVALLVADTFELMVLPFERDDIFIGQMVQVAETFWNTNVIGKVAPPMELPDLAAKFVKDEIKTQASPDIIQNVSALKEIKEKIKTLTDAKEVIEDSIKVFIGEKSVLTDGETVLATWKSVEKKAYEVKASSSRQLRIK